MTTNTRVKDLKTLDDASAKKIKDAARAAMPTAPAAPDSGIHPGVERWPVKTGTDADAAKVGVNNLNGQNLGPGIVSTTIAEMRALPRAANMPPVTTAFEKNSFYQDRRAVPTETTIWKLDATVTMAKLEQDGDYHLVLQDAAGNTMIGEIPNPQPSFVGNPTWLADIATARAEMDKKLGGPLKAVDFAPETMAPPTKERFAAAPEKDESSSMTPVNAAATIIGVGFFDSSHGQTGVAPTAIELHPIFSIVFK